MSFVTTNANLNVRTVTFDYLVAENPNDQWWSICWTFTAESSDATVYAHTNTYTGCGGVMLPQDVQAEWRSITVEIPEGEWRFYIGGAKGSWGEGYVVLDNVVMKDASGNVVASESFDANGYGIFANNRPANVMMTDGKPNTDE